MSESTKIAWCDATFNPWIGCTKCGPGCDNCYAERDFDKRRHFAEWGEGKPRRRTSESNWRKPIQWNKKSSERYAGGEDHGTGRRMKVLCGSLCDIGDTEVPQKWFEDVMNLVTRTPDLIWLFLTKRPESLRARQPLPNLWLGVTVCNQDEADEKIPVLLEIPAVKRFISIEPMLSSINLHRFDHAKCATCGYVGPSVSFNHANAGDYSIFCPSCGADERGVGDIDIPGVDWVIVGGETGPGARFMNPEWARGVRDQCKNGGVPFFFKQMTNKAETPDDLLIREMPH